MFLGTILSINPKNNIYAMNAQWNKWIYIIGIILFFIGVLDPLEGSVIIALGCIFITVALYYRQDSYRKIQLLSTVLILLGATMMFILSALGGIGGTSPYSTWWALSIIPYPLGWLLSFILLIRRSIIK